MCVLYCTDDAETVLSAVTHSLIPDDYTRTCIYRTITSPFYLSS